jgi:hypothetical protein
VRLLATLRHNYAKIVLDRPRIALAVILAIVAFFTWHTRYFHLDASSDTLVLQTDNSLKFYNTVRERYGADDYLIVTYLPKKGELFDKRVLDDLGALRDKLKSLPRITGVTSILDVPLIESGDINLAEAGGDDLPTLEGGNVPVKKAKKELVTSPLYKNVLISGDGDMAALLVSIENDSELVRLYDKRQSLRGKDQLSPAEQQRLDKVSQRYAKRKQTYNQRQEATIAKVRDVLDQHRGNAEIFLGGVPMIVVDSINFIEKDLRVFGIGVLGLIVVLLGLFFRSPRWVILPLLTCGLVAVTSVGLFGLLAWPATIVSANFVALLMIFTLSFCVHQIVRYRECAQLHPLAGQRRHVEDMVNAIALPCFYMGVTTAVAFSALVISDLKPVIDFGFMMAIGLGVAFIIAFTFFPAVNMVLRPESTDRTHDSTAYVTHLCARCVHTARQRASIVAVFIVIMGVCGWASTNLYVQNRFIDYYAEDTEIYQGMLRIDKKLGGTTPMDIIVDAPQDVLEYQANNDDMGIGSTGPELLQGYWMSDVLFEDIARIHTYLDSLPSTGKVMSLHTTLSVLKSMNQGSEIDRFKLGVIYQKMPEHLRDVLFDPYISKDGNQLRFGVRVHETSTSLNREALIHKIKTHLTGEMGLKDDQVRLTGLVVLYNNVLQSLFESQIMTLGAVFVALFAVFLLLFRNVGLALIALVPNIAVVFMVLGIMGAAGIPLDIMTITIAAICFGIANDNTIHYIHRFRAEFAKDGNYQAAVVRAHRTIGRAMYYTALTIMLGFSILMASNFVPTVYFGMLTAASMLAALVADLIVLPALIMMFKPLHPGQKT